MTLRRIARGRGRPTNSLLRHQGWRRKHLPAL